MKCCLFNLDSDHTVFNGILNESSHCENSPHFAVSLLLTSQVLFIRIWASYVPPSVKKKKKKSTDQFHLRTRITPSLVLTRLSNAVRAEWKGGEEEDSRGLHKLGLTLTLLSHGVPALSTPSSIWISEPVLAG